MRLSLSDAQTSALPGCLPSLRHRRAGTKGTKCLQIREYGRNNELLRTCQLLRVLEHLKSREQIRRLWQANMLLLEPLTVSNNGSLQLGPVCGNREEPCATCIGLQQQVDHLQGLLVAQHTEHHLQLAALAAEHDREARELTSQLTKFLAMLND